jgi:hypothetical protein
MCARDTGKIDLGRCGADALTKGMMTHGRNT